MTARRHGTTMAPHGTSGSYSFRCVEIWAIWNLKVELRLLKYSASVRLEPGTFCSVGRRSTDCAIRPYISQLFSCISMRTRSSRERAFQSRLNNQNAYIITTHLNFWPLENLDCTKNFISYLNLLIEQLMNYFRNSYFSLVRKTTCDMSIVGYDNHISTLEFFHVYSVDASNDGLIIDNSKNGNR